MPPAKSFSASLDRTEPVVVLVVAGELDAATVADLADAFEEVVTAHQGHVVVAGEAITFIDSTGTSALVAGSRRLNRNRRRLALACGPGTALGRALSMSGLDRMFEVHATTDGAVAALADAPLLGR